MNRCPSFSLPLASALALGLLTGCGLGNLATDPIADPAAAPNVMHGMLRGGPNPIANATLSLYVTANNGYGGAAVVGPTTTSGSDGSFNFTLPNTFACPAGQFAYLTSYAGNTGAKTVNNNSLLIVPVGACASSYSVGSGGQLTYIGPSLYINELTTIATAYALSGFTTIDTSGATPVVNISAPANNNSITPCVAGVGTCTTTAAAGLQHAFANAFTLVNITSGQINTKNRNGGLLPYSPISTLGNILQACVNSTGVSGTNTTTSNDGTVCGKIFSLTALPTTGALATNTLQAMLNLAHYPKLTTTNTWNSTCTASSNTTSAASCFFNLAAPTGFYNPALTGAPPDWAMLIAYPLGSGAGANTTTNPGLTYPYMLALDIADNIYISNNDTSSQGWEDFIAFANDGTFLWNSGKEATYHNAKYIAVDALNHFVVANDTGSLSSSLIRIYNATTGVLQTSLTAANANPFGVTVDPSNNIWYGVDAANVQNINELLYSGNDTNGNPTYTPYAFSTTPKATQGLYQLAFDANLNLWAIGDSSSTANVFYLPNSGSASSPAYTGTLANGALTGATNGGSIAYGIAIDNSGNAWTMDVSGLMEVVPGGTATNPTLTPSGTDINTGATIVRYATTDGDGVIWGANNNNGASATGPVVYDPVHSLNIGTIKACFATGLACSTATGQGSNVMLGPRGVAIDSSGDVWIPSATGGSLSELVGAAAPTWPQQSLVKNGRPQ